MIRVACPACSALIHVDRVDIGKPVLCPKCGGSIRVRARGKPVPRQQRATARKSGLARRPLILGAAAAVIFVGFAVGGLIYSLHTRAVSDREAEQARIAEAVADADARRVKAQAEADAKQHGVQARAERELRQTQERAREEAERDAARQEADRQLQERRRKQERYFDTLDPVTRAVLVDVRNHLKDKPHDIEYLISRSDHPNGLPMLTFGLVNEVIGLSGKDCRDAILALGDRRGAAGFLPENPTREQIEDVRFTIGTMDFETANLIKPVAEMLHTTRVGDLPPDFRQVVGRYPKLFELIIEQSRDGIHKKERDDDRTRRAVVDEQQRQIDKLDEASRSILKKVRDSVRSSGGRPDPLRLADLFKGLPDKRLLIQFHDWLGVSENDVVSAIDTIALNYPGYDAVEQSIAKSKGWDEAHRLCLEFGLMSGTEQASVIAASQWLEQRERNMRLNGPAYGRPPIPAKHRKTIQEHPTFFPGVKLSKPSAP